MDRALSPGLQTRYIRSFIIAHGGHPTKGFANFLVI